MFGKVNKTSKTVSVKEKKNEEKTIPAEQTTQHLAQYRQELIALVKKAAEDGEITRSEYKQLCELTQKSGISQLELNDMIRMELKQDLIAKIQLFVEDDGEVDDQEMRSLIYRAKEIGINKNELDTYVNEALAKYKKEDNENFRKKMRKVGVFFAVAATGAAAAFIGLQAQKNSSMVNASKLGNYKVSLSTITHASSKNQDN